MWQPLGLKNGLKIRSHFQSSIRVNSCQHTTQTNHVCNSCVLHSYLAEHYLLNYRNLLKSTSEVEAIQNYKAETHWKKYKPPQRSQYRWLPRPPMSIKKFERSIQIRSLFDVIASKFTECTEANWLLRLYHTLVRTHSHSPFINSPYFRFKKHTQMHCWNETSFT